MMAKTSYAWFAENVEFEKNFLSYLVNHQKMHGAAAVSWKTSERADSHICGSSPKKFPALKNKRENRFKQLTQGLEALGVVVEKLNNSYTWSVPDAAVRNKLETVLASAPKDWLETAEELVEEYASVFSEVGINLERELARAQGEGTTKTQTAATWAAWFRKNRLPALESSRWYLRGVNREGTIRNSAPFSGYIE
tara:strand:+ start:337 stop:921 length:585 start_codon:yes stop_codon:yes gene_type:complete